MKKCNNNKVPIVQSHFLFKVTFWLTLFSISSNLIEGSHLPATYILKDATTLESHQDISSSETTQDGFISDETSTFPQSMVDIDPSSSESKTSTFQPVAISSTTLQHKLIRQDDEVTVISTSSSTSSSTATSSEAVTSSSQARIGQETDDDLNLTNTNGKRYHDVQASCDESQMIILGQFVKRFKGRIYAYGYPDEPECGVTAANDPHKNVTFILPLGRCGVQMLPIDPEFEEVKRHEVTLYVQYSSFLQQVVDDKVTVSCVEVKRNPMEDLHSLEMGDLGSTRQGRRMGVVKDTKGGQTKISSTIGESWMEVLAGKDPSPKSRKMLPVSVGQDVTLVISTKVMRGYDARIVNCSANDGTRIGSIDGYRSQQILDSAGCSVDTALVPNFRRRRLPIESRNRMITLHFATFPAFKFPERDHLHIKCSVAYCQGPCPQEPCDSGINHFGTWREKYGRIADALIDTVEIVNSVEVTAPELEDTTTGGGHYFARHQSSGPGSYTSGGGGSATDISSRQFTDTSNSHGNNGNGHSSPSLASSSSSSSSSGDNQVPLLQPSFVNGGGGGSVCVSPGSVILALVILGVVLVISATATLWFALKRSEAKKYRQAVKHTPFQHGPQPYYRFSHW